MSDWIQQEIVKLSEEHGKLSADIDLLETAREDTADILERNRLKERIERIEHKQQEMEDRIQELARQSVKIVLDNEAEKFNYTTERTYFRPFLQRCRGRQMGAAVIHGGFDFGQNWIFKVLLKKNGLNVKPILLSNDKVTQRNASWIDYFISKLGAALYQGEREHFEIFRRYQRDTDYRLSLVTERLKKRLSNGETIVIKIEDWLAGKIRKEDRAEFLTEFFHLCWKEWCAALNPIIAQAGGALLFVLLESTETPLLEALQNHFELDPAQCLQASKPIVFNIEPVQESDLNNWYIHHIMNCENNDVIEALSDLIIQEKRIELIDEAEGKHLELFYLLYQKCGTEFDHYD
jgi:hypothetical protein